MSADGPAFVAAAVQAACLAKAPRRTVQAVAAAVAGVFAHPAAAHAPTATEPLVLPSTQRTSSKDDDGDATPLLTALTSARSAQSRRKRARCRENRAGAESMAAAAATATNASPPSASAADHELGAKCGGLSASPAAVSSVADASFLPLPAHLLAMTAKSPPPTRQVQLPAEQNYGDNPAAIMANAAERTPHDDARSLLGLDASSVGSADVSRSVCSLRAAGPY